jgi:hypothetical protein
VIRVRYTPTPRTAEPVVNVLLGRDVLNALHTHLDGPGRMLTVSAQPPAAATP